MGTNLFDFGDPFARELWACILPSAFVILFCTTLIPVLGSVPRPFRTFLTLEEAEAYEAAHEHDEGRPSDCATLTESATSTPRTVALSGLALLQFVVWLGLGSYSFAIHAKTWDIIVPVVIAATWLYASLRPITWSSNTVFSDLFALYLAHIVTGFIVLGGSFFDHSVYQHPLPSQVVLAARVLSLSVLIILLAIVLNMPLAVPSTRVNKDDVGKSVSPEDYCTLWDWISFHWIVPLIEKGTYKTLNEDNVWKLSPTLSSRPLTSSFKDLDHAHIIWKLWTVNSGDMIWGFLLGFLSTVFTYAGPFFLQRILAAIENPTPENHATAYIYAFAAFFAALLEVRHQNCPHVIFH